MGERLLLVNHVHRPAETPYRASHAILVRRDAVRASLEPGEIPEAPASRLLSLRRAVSVACLIIGLIRVTAAVPPILPLLTVRDARSATGETNGPATPARARTSDASPRPRRT